MVQVRDAKIKVLSGLPLSTKEEREEWEKLAASLKVNILYRLLVTLLFYHFCFLFWSWFAFLVDSSSAATPLQAEYSKHLQLFVEILDKIFASQGTGDDKFSVSKVTIRLKASHGSPL